MKCSGCLEEATSDTVGIRVTPISFSIGRKSGQPIGSPDFFPDGSEEKFLCFDCLAGETPVIELLGFTGTGYDFDPNVFDMRPGDSGDSINTSDPTGDSSSPWTEIWPIVLGTIS